MRRGGYGYPVKKCKWHALPDVPFSPKRTFIYCTVKLNLSKYTV